MTYLRSYVRKMLQSHPYGDEFKSICELSNVGGSSHNYRDEPVGNKVIEILLFLFLFGEYNTRSRRRSQWKYDATEEALAKTSILLNKLDSSDDSNWLVTYMAEEGARNCEEVKKKFEEYLESCKG